MWPGQASIAIRWTGNIKLRHLWQRGNQQLAIDGRSCGNYALFSRGRVVDDVDSYGMPSMSPPPNVDRRRCRYRTIMSYDCGSPYINCFSNPDVLELGKPTGTITANNAEMIRSTMVRRAQSLQRFSRMGIEPWRQENDFETFRPSLVCWPSPSRPLSGERTTRDNDRHNRVCLVGAHPHKGRQKNLRTRYVGLSVDPTRNWTAFSEI